MDYKPYAHLSDEYEVTSLIISMLEKKAVERDFYQPGGYFYIVGDRHYGVGIDDRFMYFHLVVQPTTYDIKEPYPSVKVI